MGIRNANTYLLSEILSGKKYSHTHILFPLVSQGLNTNFYKEEVSYVGRYTIQKGYLLSDPIPEKSIVPVG